MTTSQPNARSTNRHVPHPVELGGIKKNIISAADHHMESMDESELVMVLKFIHSLKDFR